MQHTIRELKEKLTRALDKENNVVDMRGVLEVVSALEKSTVTRDCLEETRIGKYINEMRKKTSNKDLAKRAKNLVKKWQQLVIPQAATCNGEKTPKSAVPQHVKTSVKPSSPYSRPDTPLSSNSNSPNVQKSGRPGTPHNHMNRQSPAVLQKSGTSGFKPISPALQTPVRSNSSVCLNRNSPYDTPRSHNGHCDRASTPSEDNVLNSGLDRKRKIKDSDGDIPDKKRVLSANGNSTSSKTVMNGLIKGPHSDSTSHMNELSSDQMGDYTSSPSFASKRQAKLNVKTDRHQLKRTPSASSHISDLSQSLDSTPASTKTPTSRTPRVKTTAQLLEEMASSGSLNLTGSEAVRKIALNQIDKEHDDDGSIVPAGAKPRPRKKPKSLAPPQTNDKTLHETKHEMVHKFLETSFPPPPPTPDVDLSDIVTGFNTARSSNESPKTGINNNSNNSFIENGSYNSGSANTNRHSDLLKFVGDDAHPSVAKPEDEKRRVSPVRIKLGARRVSSEQDDTVLAKTAEIITNHSTQDPWSLLPAIDPDNIRWDSLDYEPPEPVEVTPSVIERLHSENWSGVNGQCDAWGDWRNWTRAYSASSYNGDLLHILPYVVLEQDDDDNDDLNILDSHISSDLHPDNGQQEQNMENS